jgi:1,2-diacylglycerol 3-beta-galactosyltransferase
MGPVAEIARAVTARLANGRDHLGGAVGQLVVICGRNHKLYDELSAADWPIPTVVNGFVHNMPDWMAACDCIITKAGPGTIAESLAIGLPMILSGYIVGQEQGNAPYVVDNGVGKYSEDPDEIAQMVYRWFGSQQDEMARMTARARRLGRPDATYQIVDEIARLLATAQGVWPCRPEKMPTRKRRRSWL